MWQVQHKQLGKSHAPIVTTEPLGGYHSVAGTAALIYKADVQASPQERDKHMRSLALQPFKLARVNFAS